MLSILSFPKNENPFSKKVVPFFIWNYCTWKPIFPYKTAQSKTNDMANRMGSIKWTYHKEQGFATTVFFESFTLLQEPLLKSWSIVPTTQIFIFQHFVSAWVLFGGTFSLWVSLNHFFTSVIFPMAVQFSVHCQQ